MYGLAGHQYTPGQPNLSTLGAKERRSKPKGVTGQVPSVKRGVKPGYKDGKYKKVQYGEA